jgi:hypothetical protein
VNRPVALLATAALMLGQSAPAFAYLKFGTSVRGQQVTLKWAQTPVRYFVSDSGVPGVTASDLQNAVGRAFATWTAVPTASITYQLAGVTSASPGGDDGASVLGFQSRPDLDRVLAQTSFLVDSSTGALIESDIFFNSAFPWSVAAAGEAGRYDLESIALHEIGHFSGLGHSALGETELISTGGRRVLSAEAVMFPIAYPSGSIAARTLKADDIAGISDLYPDGDFTTADGSLSGSVTKDGQPLSALTSSRQSRDRVDGGQLHIERAGVVLDRRALAGTACRSGRADRRCGGGQFLQWLAEGGHRFPRDVLRSRGRGSEGWRQRRDGCHGGS